MTNYSVGIKNKHSFIKAIVKYRYIYLLMLPGFLVYLIYCYVPMTGIIIAFQDYDPLSYGIVGGIFNSTWVGLNNLYDFFQSYYFWTLLKNTLVISGLKLIFGFPVPIIFALLLNEIRNRKVKKLMQVVTSFPNFISWVIVAGIMVNLFDPQTGLFNLLFQNSSLDIMGDQQYLYPNLILSAIWKGFGYGAIIYLAALSGIDQEQYEAAVIDGASGFQKMIYITLPGLKSVIIIMLLLSIGGLLNADVVQMLNFVGDKAYMYDKGDVIDTYVYRAGLIQAQYSYSTMVGLFKGIINTILIVGADRFAKALGQQGIW